MILDEIVVGVADELPKFNKNTIMDYDNNQLESAVDFIDICFKLAIKLIGCDDLVYRGYTILTPKERADYELTGKDSKKNKDVKSVPLLLSDLQLIKFIFHHKTLTDTQTKIFEKSVYLYVPYLYQNMLNINGKRMSIVKSIVEKIFSKITATVKNKTSTKITDGVMIRPIRARLSFMRYPPHLIKDTQDKVSLREYIIGAKLHLKSHNKRKVQTTILHYLLCKFGLVTTIEKFGFSTNDFVVSKENLNLKDPSYLCFPIYNTSNDIYINVKQEFIHDHVLRKFIVNMHYILSNFHEYEINDLYDGDYIYRVFLGMIIYPQDHIAKAKADIDVHIDTSVDYFIDPIMKKKLEIFGIPESNIYELMMYIFMDINKLVSNCSNDDLFTKRLDITDGILVKSYAEKIFRSLYDNRQRSSLKPAEVDLILQIYPMAITNAYNPTTGNKSKKETPLKNINRSPQIFGDNWLISCGCSKIRKKGSAIQKIDPSLPIVESIHWFTGSMVGVGGGINPFVEIDQNGVFVKPPYAKEILDIYEE